MRPPRVKGLTANLFYHWRLPLQKVLVFLNMIFNAPLRVHDREYIPVNNVQSLDLPLKG